MSLDGVFFSDGSFIGPNRRGLWEQVVFSADAHLQAAKIAIEFPRAAAFAQLQRMIGAGGDQFPPPPPPTGATPESYRKRALDVLAGQISRMRKMNGDERTLEMIREWASAPVPVFRKL